MAKRKYSKRSKLSVADAPFAPRHELVTTPKRAIETNERRFKDSLEFVASLDKRQFFVLKSLVDAHENGVRDEAQFFAIADRARELFDLMTA